MWIVLNVWRASFESLPLLELSNLYSRVWLIHKKHLITLLTTMKHLNKILVRLQDSTWISKNSNSNAVTAQMWMHQPTWARHDPHVGCKWGLRLLLTQTLYLQSNFSGDARKLLKITGVRVSAAAGPRFHSLHYFCLYETNISHAKNCD